MDNYILILSDLAEAVETLADIARQSNPDASIQLRYIDYLLPRIKRMIEEESELQLAP